MDRPEIPPDAASLGGQESDTIARSDVTAPSTPPAESSDSEPLPYAAHGRNTMLDTSTPISQEGGQDPPSGDTWTRPFPFEYQPRMTEMGAAGPPPQWNTEPSSASMDPEAIVNSSNIPVLY